jgi:pyruvate dehydrogenase E1 component alpha subunit
MAVKKGSAKPNVSAEELTKYYRDMLLIRRFEEKAGQLYGMGLNRWILPPLHRPRGRCCRP